MAIEIVRHGVTWSVWIMSLPVLIIGVAWFLLPYSRRARRVVLPSSAWFARMRDVNRSLRQVPILGSLLRFGDRLTDDAGAKATREQELWSERQRAQFGDDEDPEEEAHAQP